ncbi:MAG TPA: hypothetical protein VN679_15430 [Candidatus Acidoferrales bacterium]|nr:hypothetical protein [Candidatus Acidoferrales bacterium]
MAFKTLYGQSGSLAVALTTVASSIVLDDELMATLRYALNNGADYTYLIVKTTTTYEVLLTESFVGNSINVARSQDGTTAQAFPVGTDVEFCMGDAAIAAMISEKALGQINITGSGIVTVTKTGTNQYQISAPAVQITSASSNILVGGEFPNFVLSAPVINSA